MLGTGCVLFSFPFIWLRCLGCDPETDDWAELIYYVAFVIIFQFGWAATQISHLSIIPDLSDEESDRTQLNSFRYAATVLSSIAVYLATWGFLGMSGASIIGPQNDVQFRNIMIFAVTLGSACSLAFHLLVKVPDNDENRINGTVNPDGTVHTRMAPGDWFREPVFYQIGVMYMSTRLFVNLTQAYVPLYLDITLEVSAEYVAIIPLVMYVLSFAASLISSYVNAKVGRVGTYVLGAVIGFVGCVWVKAGCAYGAPSTEYQIYGVATLLGFGGSLMLITSLAAVTDMIGANKEASAFVFGSMSLCDKFSNGVAVILIQHFIPSNQDACIHCRDYFRDILFYVCGFSGLLGAAAMLSVIKKNLGERSRRSYESLPGGTYPAVDEGQPANDPLANDSIIS